MTTSADFLVVGGGVVGLFTAWTFRRRHPDQRVVVLEKEPEVGAHASGRNSGVLHAGFYYSADSLKARFSREGNAAWIAFCEERELPLNRCGKLVLCRDEGDHAGLDELLRRAEVNGVDLRDVTPEEVREIEPRARTAGRAAYASATATVDPGACMRALREAAEASGVEVRTGVTYQGRAPDGVRTDAGVVPAGFVLNAAGTYADRVARDFGLGAGVRIVPFKGLYLYSSGPPGELRTNLYPVPDLKNPFLGVHFTVTVDGRAKIGPTAMPALGREHYGGLSGLRPGELAEVAATHLDLALRAGFDYRGLALRELQKMSRRRLVADASWMADGVRLEDYTTWGRPGIRAQLVDLATRRLVMDFRVEVGDASLHVLNSISPAFTCAPPFAEFLCDRVEEAC
jgi:L-2-hydroxyglutarate oxidase LhgO